MANLNLDGDAQTALDTVMAILADRGVAPTAERIICECDAARAYLATAANYLADRWMPAYARVATAVRS